MTALQLIDELEQLLEESKGGWFGKRLISEQQFSCLIRQLRTMQSSAPPQQGINELEQLVKAGIPLSPGKYLVTEEDFLSKTAELRKAVMPQERGHLSSNDIPLGIIDELEQMVANGMGGWLGKRLVDEGPFVTRIADLRASLTSAAAIQVTHQLDGLANYGGASLIGKCLIDESEFFIKLQILRSILAADSQKRKAP